MKRVILNELEYYIPTSWDDITIKDYQRIYKQIGNYNESVKEEKINEFDDVMESIKLVSAYSSIPEKELKIANISDVIGIINDMSFIKEEIPSKQIVEFKFKNKVYNVIQSLHKQQFQDYVSLENILQRGNNVENMHYILAIMSREGIDETLDDYDVDERAKEFLNLDIITANNISVFFSSLEKVYTQISMLSSHPKEVIQMKAQEVMSSLNALDGQGWYTRWQIGITKRLVSYLERKSMKYFTSRVPKYSIKESKLKILIKKVKKYLHIKFK